MQTMFDTLLQLPLLQGLAKEELTSIVGKVKLHFSKYKAGEPIVHAGMPCCQLLFILQGEVSRSVKAPDASYCMTESLQAPWLVEPYSLFGKDTAYVGSYAAENEVCTISISKSFILSELFKYEIFRLNYLNILSSRAQNLETRLQALMPDGTDKRIAHFILTHVECPSGCKRLKIKMEELARILHDTRPSVSKALNAMQQNGLVELRRGEIVIPQAEKLK